jgi:sensor histidine kinase YesM
MKPKLLLFSLFTFIILNISFAQSRGPVPVQSLISDDKFDTIHIYYLNTSHLIAYYPNKVFIKSKTDKIKEIQISSGTSEKLNDSTFIIKPKGSKDEIYFTLIGHKKYKYHETITPLPDPEFFCLKNLTYVLQREFPRYEGSKYTIDDIIQNGRIIVVPFFGMDSLFKIIEFQLSINTAPNKEIKISSPVFKNDSIPASYSESLRKYFTKPLENFLLDLKFQYIKVIGPDSVIRTINNEDFTYIYKDSTNLLISKYNIFSKFLRSNIRIKVFGNPNAEDLQTVNNIVNEINSLNSDIKAKIVNLFPSIGIYIDTLDTSFGAGALNGTEQFNNTNLFFPNLSYTKIFLNVNFKGQLDRDLFLWQKITRSFANFSGQPSDYKNSIIIGKSKTPGLSNEDRIVLKALLSNNFYKKGEMIMRNEPPDLSKILLFVFFTMILFFIFYELISYFNFGSHVKNVLLLNSVYSILVAQLFILISFLIQKDFLKDLFQSEIYFCAFALAVGLLFFVSDRLLKKYISTNWLRLTFNPVLTVISLYLGYQFIYLFVRGEFLRFITIDINAIIIGLSIMVVRFYLQYENEKVTSLLQEKEYELTRQRELKNRAELSTLQAKINPHFLYNALNSIAALAHIDSTRTEEMALSLSKLFRYNLNREENMSSTIRQEIEMVQLYLQIEKQRFADRLSFEVSISENLYERQVPRFLIQPLIENAIKHGVSQITGQGVIKLKIYEESKYLFIEIHDNGPEFQQGLVTGYGLQNTYDKLTLVYKKPYEVRFVNKPEKYIQIKL